MGFILYNIKIDSKIYARKETKMGLMQSIFGTHSQRQVKKLGATVDKINSLGEKYAQMSESQLKGQTALLKERLAKGETTDDVLPDAFAVVREAAKRVLGTPHYDVQLVGGIILHQGRIAEMKTGEGKTLMATLPAYLNALTGKGVHIVTVNDYLAKRDSEWMGKIYHYLGLSVGLIVPGGTHEEKKKAYDADITYGTNNEFGFDYLRDNMVLYKKDLVQRSHSFAIVDEVDSILIDEARTPLIISGAGEASSPLYQQADRFARTLKITRIRESNEKSFEDEAKGDCIVDEKARSVTLTPTGVEKAEKYFGVENLADPENAALSHHINQALRANGIMKRDVDYVVKDSQVIIVDGFTGRLMPGRRYSDGLHQAIEAKEKVEVEKENRTLATITFQNYFRLYDKLSGMTGTALTEETEFREIYKLDVVEVPTNRPMIRKDDEDRVYKSEAAKFKAVIAAIREAHQKGQPVLVGTVSIDKSELVSALLKKEGIPHNVLNAKQHQREAQIVAQAGMPGAVTIATNMAGRGTDIRLGGNPEFMALEQLRKEGFEEELVTVADSFFETDDEKILQVRERYNQVAEEYRKKIEPDARRAREAGGLYIIGTERHESRRIDNQLRGRSGRQGDPGRSTFFLSFEDDLIRLFGGEKGAAMLMSVAKIPDEEFFEAKIVSGLIERAQKNQESINFVRRKNVLNYDDVMNQQRNLIYSQRKDVLDGMDLKERLLGMLRDTVSSAVSAAYAPDDQGRVDPSGLKKTFSFFLEEDFVPCEDKDDTEQLLQEKARKFYLSKEEPLGAEIFREMERVMLLRTVDEKWMDHIDAMSELSHTIHLRAYGQKDPLVEYKMLGSEMFAQMVESIRNDTVMGLLRITPVREVKREAVAKITGASHGGGDAPVKKQPVKKAASEKVGRNDLCPCGSGIKYKKCCGAGKNQED